MKISFSFQKVFRQPKKEKNTNIENEIPGSGPKFPDVWEPCSLPKGICLAQKIWEPSGLELRMRGSSTTHKDQVVHSLVCYCSGGTRGGVTSGLCWHRVSTFLLIFRPSATVSQIGLVESRLRRCHGGPRPPTYHIPHTTTPPAWHENVMDGWALGLYAKRTCCFPDFSRPFHFAAFKKGAKY